LSFQGFDEELRRLPGDYAGPGGVLMLFTPDGGEPAGCIAARRWSSDACEMKRLFVRDRFRGMGAGRALVEAVIAWARTAGYKRMLLDTLPSMEGAQRLYTDFGFRERPPYRFNPVEGARFMELPLGSLKRPAARRLPSAPRRRRRRAHRPPRSPR
jgi:GNAT superfamily N-acetyltransferase